MTNWLLVAHIIVLGYWLGSELVINAIYRLVCFSDDMPFGERDRLMDHVMSVDQHVRYALVLQVILGTMLAAKYGFVPGGNSTVTAAVFFGVAWLGFVECIHRLRKHPIGHRLAQLDRALRYALIIVFVAVAFGFLGEAWAMPLWLRWKLAAFAVVMACGVGIRIALLAHFRIWKDMSAGNLTAANNAIIKRTYVRATSVLVLLWVFIAVVAFLSIDKPAL